MARTSVAAAPHRLLAALAILVALAVPASAEDPMTPERMFQIARALDPAAESQGTLMQLTVAEIPILIVFDPAADRMRAITPIRSADGLDRDALYRMMQANFDTALDARYAVAQGKLWAAFIHPMAALNKESLISGIGQVANLALSYGDTFTSGALSFGGGDSGALIEELLKRGERI